MTAVVVLALAAQTVWTPGTVHVRTVDQDALALSGIEVTAIEVSECRSRTQTSPSVVKDVTRRDGLVSLALPRAHAYVIRSAAVQGSRLPKPVCPISPA
jgi:hypothetical protein